MNHSIPARPSARAGRVAATGLLALLASCTQPAPENKPSADAQARQMPTLEAPYVGAPDEAFFECIHLSISEWRCPETSTDAAFSASSITSATVTYTLKDGRKITRAVSPEADAIFLTRGAARTFLLRYYKATAPDKAAALEQRLQQATAK